MIFWGVWFWGCVIAQAICTVYVITATVAKWPLSQRRWVQIWWAYSVAATPVLWHALSAFAFVAEWKGERAWHWFYYIHDEMAGLILVPFLLITALFVSRALTNEGFRRQSTTTLIMMLSSAAICAWYTISVLLFDFTNSGMVDDVNMLAWLFFPTVSGLNYVLVALMFWRESERRAPKVGFVIAWVGGIFAALVAKVILAMRFYVQLPDEKPGCFVVSAAAKGHPSLVGSWQHPELNKPVNRQWERFKAFEDVLALRSPQIHRALRGVYNRIGPVLACGVRNPWMADAVYLALKPLEYSVVAIGWLGRRFPRT
jgi:hypothetical protein